MNASVTDESPKVFTIADTAIELVRRLDSDPAASEQLLRGLVNNSTYDALSHLEEEWVNGVTELNDLYESAVRPEDGGSMWGNDRRKNNEKAKKLLAALTEELHERRRAVNKKLKKDINAMMRMLESDRKQVNTMRKGGAK